MPNGQDPVILTTEQPGVVKINIDDPNKPKLPPKYTQQIKAKPSFGAKMKHAFLGSEVDDVGDYILKQYLEPTGKRLLNNTIQTILKTISNGAQVLLFGKVVSDQNQGVDYTSFYNPNIAPNNNNNNQQKAYKVMDAVDTFVLSKADADETLAYLRGRIREFGSSSVVDYYEHIHAPVDYMMVDRGWVNLDSARVLPMPGNGYYIDLPRPIYLKRG